MVKVLKILGWLFAAIMGSLALLVGVLWATGQFKQTTVELDSIVFDELVYDNNNIVRIPNFGGVEDVTMVLDDFESKISFTPENATNKTLRLQVNKGASLVKVPQTVIAGEPFEIQIVKDEKGVSTGGEVEISAFDTRGLTATSTPLKFFIDQPVTKLTTSLDSVYQYTIDTLTFSVSSSPISALNPTKEPNKYTDEAGNVCSAKKVMTEVYDVKPSALQVITNLNQKENVVDLVHNTIESRWQFGVGRDGKTIFVFKTFDTYKLAYDYEMLQVTKDNFDTKIEQVNAFLNKYIEKIRTFQFDYDVESMTANQVTIGNRYKVVRNIGAAKSESDENVYSYEYQIVTHSGQPLSGQSFIDMVKLSGQDKDIIGVENYETFLDAMEYLYVIATKQVSIVNAEAAELICNDRLTLDVHEKRIYQTNQLREQLGVKIIPNETSANLDNRIVDVKAFGARLIDGTYYLEDYDVNNNKSQVQEIVDLLNSDKNISNKQGHVFDVLKIKNKAQDATIVVDNPKVDTTWSISVYNKLQNVKEKTYIVFTYYDEGGLDEESNQTQELMYYALMEVQIEQQEVDSLRFNYDQNDRYNHVILSTEHSGTRIGNVTFSHALTLPNDLASIYQIGDKQPTYTTIKYFALADTVLNNGRFVIKVDQSKVYQFDGASYYEVTSRDVASGNVRIEALNASLYENERYVPVEIYAYVVKTDINGNIIYQDGSYIPVSSRSNNRMEYIVRPFINDIYVYTNFNGEYLLRNNESEAYSGLYDVDGTVYKDENRANDQANILGTTVQTIIKADRNIKVLIDQEFEVIVTNKILRSNGADFRNVSNGEDYAFNYKRALEDTNLLYNIASYMWFQADGKDYDLEGYRKGTNPSTNPEVTQPEKYEGEIPFSLLSSEYDKERGLIVVKLKANTSLSDQYLDISYRRVVEEVDDANGNALQDTITIDARLQIQGYYLELADNTSILAGYGADHYLGQSKEEIVWADRPYAIPVSGKVAGRLETWQVTNYAMLSEKFRQSYAENYNVLETGDQSVSIDEHGTVGGNYAFSLKALQFNYQLQIPEILEEQGISIDTYPDLVVNYTPYLAIKEEENGSITYKKGLPATDYIRLTQNSTKSNVATITFLKAPTTAIDILFECDIYLYETSKTTNHHFQNKFYLKHFQFTSTDTIMSLVQQDPMFDLLQFNEQGLVINNGKPITNTRQSQSILKGGTEFNLNGVNGAVRVGFSVEENDADRVKADSEVFSACTFSIDNGSESSIYFNLDGQQVHSVKTNGKEIKNLSIGAYSTNVRREASFTVYLLGISVTYYVTVESNIDILFNQFADGNDAHFISYNDTKTINASADQTLNLNEYFKVQGTKDIVGEIYQPIFYIKLGQDTSNYFILNNNILQVGRAYEDKEIVLGINYEILLDEKKESYTTTSEVVVKLAGVPAISGTIDHPFDSNHHMTLTLANGKPQDLSEYVTGITESTNYHLSIDDSKISEEVIDSLFGNNVSGAMSGWTLTSRVYYEIVRDIPIFIKFIENVKNGNDFVEVEHDTGYMFYITLQPEVAFEEVENQVMVDNSSPQQPNAFGYLPLYDKVGEKVIKLKANGSDEVFYYGYESAELLQNDSKYLGDVLSIVEQWNKDKTELLTLSLRQNRSVDKDTTFTLKIYTKYGEALDITIIVKCNYIGTVNYPFHGSKTGGAQREEIRVGTTIDLLSAYVNELPRIYVYANGSSAINDATIIKNIQAYAGSQNVTALFSIQGSTLTLERFTSQNNYITLEVELFNGLKVDYELEVIVGEASVIHNNGNQDQFDNETNTLTIYGQQVFYLRDYFISSSAYFGVIKENSNSTSLLKVNNMEYLAYYPISSDTAIQFGDVSRKYTLELDMYSRFAVAGDEQGKKTINLTVIPNIVVRGKGNALPANHPVLLSNYLEIERGYTDSTVEPLTFGPESIISYSNDFTIFQDGSTCTLQYNYDVFETIHKNLTLIYKGEATYTVEMTITSDVNFNFKDNNIFYGSTTSNTYQIDRSHWTQNGKGYTDYLGEKIEEYESFEEEILYLEGNKDDGVVIDQDNHQVIVGAVNKRIQVKVIVTYKVFNDQEDTLGSVVGTTILTILPNIRDIIGEDKSIDVYTGNYLKVEMDQNEIKIGDVTLFTLTNHAVEVEGERIQPSILFDIEEEAGSLAYRDLTNYVFVGEDGKLCFRNVNESVSFNIPFRLNLREEIVEYQKAYQDTRLYVHITLHPSVESLGLNSSYSSATTKENAVDLLVDERSINQVPLGNIVTLNGVTGANNLEISYLYTNFEVQVRNNSVWNIVDNRLQPVDASLLGDKVFVTYNYEQGLLTFAPCSASMVVGVTIILGGTHEIEVYVKLNAVGVTEADSIVAEEGSVRIVKQIDNADDAQDKKFIYKIKTNEGYTWMNGDVFTFDLKNLLSYENNKYSKDAFVISATSTSNWLTYKGNGMLVLQVPDENNLTPDSGIVEVIIGVGLDLYQFTIAFE